MKIIWYFQSGNQFYQNVNAKGRKIQKFADKYINVLFDEKSMMAFFDTVKELCKTMDEENPRTIPFIVSWTETTVNNGKAYRLEISQKERPDNLILTMDFTLVQRIEHYEYGLNHEDKEGGKK
ncbi:MAG: hypothetical protein LKE54_03675 [Prevotella sp.]|jgi:hypothetical protein|nr:hypothetical protein [Prevotella sp.]MCH3994146.1 hypothetical protein [Prevotella sp.]